MGRFAGLAVQTRLSEMDLERAAWEGRLGAVISESRPASRPQGQDRVHASLVEKFREMEKRKQQMPGLWQAKADLEIRQRRAVRQEFELRQLEW